MCVRNSKCLMSLIHGDTNENWQRTRWTWPAVQKPWFLFAALALIVWRLFGSKSNGAKIWKIAESVRWRHTVESAQQTRQREKEREIENIELGTIRICLTKFTWLWNRKRKRHGKKCSRGKSNALYGLLAYAQHSMMYDEWDFYVKLPNDLPVVLIMVTETPYGNNLCIWTYYYTDELILCLHSLRCEVALFRLVQRAMLYTHLNVREQK